MAFFFFLPSGRAGHFVLSFVLIQKERTKEKIKATEKLTVCLFIRLKQMNSGLYPSNSVCFSTPHSLTLKTGNFSKAEDIFLRKNIENKECGKISPPDFEEGWCERSE